MLREVPLLVTQSLSQVPNMQLALQLKQLLGLLLPRRQKLGQVIQKRERVDNVRAHLSGARKLRLHALPIHQLLLVSRLQPVAVIQAVDSASHCALEVVVEVYALLTNLVPLT